MRPKPGQLKLKMSNQIETIPKEMVTTLDGASLSSLSQPEVQSSQVQGQPGLRNKLQVSLNYKKLYLLIYYLKLKRQCNSGHSFETALCMVEPTCNFSIRDTRGKGLVWRQPGLHSQILCSDGTYASGHSCFRVNEVVEIVDVYYRTRIKNHGHWHTVPTGLNCVKFHIPRENRHSPEPLKHKYLDKLLWQGPGPQACTVLLSRQTFPKLAPWSSRLWWRQACNLPCCIEWVPFYPMLSIVLKNPNLTLVRRFKDTVL